jgi:hypothetical protein
MRGLKLGTRCSHTQVFYLYLNVANLSRDSLSEY